MLLQHWTIVATTVMALLLQHSKMLQQQTTTISQVVAATFSATSCDVAATFEFVAATTCDTVS
ncbi:MAG: hypothetical protein ACYC3O_07665 [Burkholderiales bacterium]